MCLDAGANNLDSIRDVLERQYFNRGLSRLARTLFERAVVQVPTEVSSLQSKLTFNLAIMQKKSLAM
jgi:hypothetical protein